MVRPVRVAHPTTSSPLYRGPRDPVTGEANVLDQRRRPVGPFIRERDYHPQRAVPDRQPLPRSFHSRQMATSYGPRQPRLGSYNGGLEWSPEFREYITHASVMPQLAVTADRTNVRCWFKLDYVYRGVLRNWPADPDRRMIAGLVAVRRDCVDMTLVATALGVTLTQLARFERKLHLFVRTAYGLLGDIRPETQVWRAPADFEGPMETGQVAG